ncbi:MAG: four helix bundle protein [bacterium]|nr:four helix bundle protein [bacterium]
MAFRFEGLEIWKESVGFSKTIYVITKSFPKEEILSLVDQLKRASVSISANIAEGSGSVSNKDFKNYLSIAIKSVFEVVSLLAIAEQNTYILNKDFIQLRSEAEVLVKRIQAFRNSLA